MHSVNLGSWLAFHIAIHQKLFEQLKGFFDGLLITFITVSVVIIVLGSIGAKMMLGGQLVWVWSQINEKNKKSQQF